MSKKKKEFKFSEIGTIMDNISKKVPIQLERENKEVEFISTGIYVLNACLSGSIYGGVKGDSITVFAGPEASGKTYLALNTLREAQKAGYNIIYIDTENTLTRGDFRKYGIDSSTDKLELIKSNKVEDINMTLTQLLDELKQAKLDGLEIPKVILVLDSLAQMASNKEKEDLISGKLKQDMTKAKAIGSMFRSITLDLGFLDIPMIVNNQIYETMDLFPQKVMKGGKSLYYSASNITFLGKAKLKTGDEEESDFQSGIKVRAKGIKNRIAKPKEVRFEIDFTTGCNPYKGLQIFCKPEYFNRIGIAIGKWNEYDVPKEVVNKDTGEITKEYGEFKPGGKKYYVKHLDKTVWEKNLYNSKVFTKEVLDAIDEVAQLEFKYNSYEEIDEVTKALESEDTNIGTDLDSDDIDNMDSEDFFSSDS